MKVHVLTQTDCIDYEGCRTHVCGVYATWFDAKQEETRLSKLPKEEDKRYFNIQEFSVEGEKVPEWIIVTNLPGVSRIALERKRQVEEEGWSHEHDAQYTKEQLLIAAMEYLLYKDGCGLNGLLWPWDPSWFKPTTRIRNLVKAGALIAAEIDRLKNEETRTVEDSSVSS